MEQNIGERQRWAWLTAGFSVVAASGTCGYGWQWVLVAGLVVALYYIVLDRKLPQEGMAKAIVSAFGGAGKLLNIICFLWLVLLIGWTACLADTAFPMVDGFPILGWSMLALTAWSSWKGAAACARCAGVLCLFLLVLYGIVVVFAVPDVAWENLKIQSDWGETVFAAGLFLLPAGVWFMPAARSRKGPAWNMAWVLPVFAAALATVTAGVLSPVLARERTVPIYDLAQSVSLFGVVERIEPLLSVAMVMGVFALLSSLACACQTLGEVVIPWKWYGVTACAAAGVGMYAVRFISLYWIAVGNGVVFGLLPIVVCWKHGHGGRRTQ